MKKDIGEAMLKKALGYKVTESVIEFQIDENGTKRPIKEKKQTKFYPPDPAALKSYLEFTGKKGMVENMTDEELEIERQRLLKELEVEENP